MLYRKSLKIDGRFDRAWLDLRKVQHYIEVFVSDKLVDTLLWPPYEIEITEHLTQGQNRLTLVVANSIANRFAWDVWGTRETAKPESSGVFGSAYLWLER